MVLILVGAACILLGSWHHFKRALIKSMLEGAGAQENMRTGNTALARFMQVLRRGDLELRSGWRGPCLQNTRAGHVVSKLGNRCCTGSHRLSMCLGWGVGVGQ